jgi:ABC-2 type transport system ATP-binding protein
MVDGRIEALGTPGQLKQVHAAQSMDEVFIKLARKAKRTDNPL